MSSADVMIFSPGRQYADAYRVAKTVYGDKGEKAVMNSPEMQGVKKLHPVMFRNFDPYRYRRSYFTGWDSVADYDKQALLRKHPELRDKTGDERNNLFKNIIFSEVFKDAKDDEAKSIWENRFTLTKGQRDNLFAQRALSHDLDELSDAADNTKGFAHYGDLYSDLARQGYAKGLGYENTLRGKAKSFLDEQAAPTRNRYREMVANMSESEKDELITNLDNASNQISNYYQKYNGTDKLNLSREEKLNLVADYLANQEVGGSLFANKVLGEYYQDTVASNQSFMEKVVNTGAQFIDSASGMIIRAGGMVMGLTSLNRLFGYNNDAGYWENVIDNDVTRYGDRVATTNVWLDLDEQKKLEEMGMSDNPILNSVAQQNSLMSWNTPFELIGQYGFTAASTVLSFGSSAALRAGTGAAAWGTRLATAGKGMKASETGLMLLQGLKKTRDIGNVFIAGAIGTIEGGMNAAQTRQAVYKDLMEGVKTRAYQDLINDPNLAGNTQEEKEANALALINDENFLRQHYGDELEQAEESAKIAMYQDFWTNSAINGLINTTLKAGLQAPRVQKSLSKLGIRKSNLDDAFTFSKTKDGWRAAMKEVTTKDVIKGRLKESLGEGLEEYKQDLSSAFSKGYTTNRMQQYIDAKYNNGEIGEAVETDMWQSIGAGMESAGNSALSSESIKSFIYGGLSTMLGGPNMKQVKFRGKKQGESTLNYVAEMSPITWRGAWTPLINHSERDALNEQRRVQEKHLNDFFSDKEVQRALFNVEGTASFLHEMEQAIQNGDEKSARDARLASMFSTIVTLNSMKDSGYFDTVMSSLQSRAAFDVNNLNDPESAESKAVDAFIADVQNRDMEYTREEALDQIVKSSSRMLELIDEVGQESSKIDKLFGKGLDSDVKSSLVYNRLVIRDSKDRINKLDEELSQVTSAVNEDPTSSTSNVNEAAKGIIVRFGSIANAVKKKEEIAKNIERDEKTLSEIESSLNNNELNPEERTVLEKVATIVSGRLELQRKDHEELSNIESSFKDSELGVLTAKNLMELSPIERAQMLSPSNRGRYSAEQQAEIDKLLGIGNSVYTDFSSKIEDRARLEYDYTEALQSQSDMMASSRALEEYAYEAKKKVVDRSYAIKNQRLLELENKGDYSAFSQELESILNGENRDEIRVVRDMLSGSEFYGKYMDEKMKKDSVRNFVNQNDNINITSEQANLFSVMQDFLSANGIEATSIDEAVEALSEEIADASIDSSGKTTLTNKRLKLQDYIDKINESLPDDKKISIKDFGSSLQTFKDIMGEYNKYVEEKAKLVQESKPSTTQNTESSKPVDTSSIPVEGNDKVTGAEPIVTQGHEEPIVDKVSRSNPSNTPVINQAEFVVGRIRSMESRYGSDAVDTALKSLNDEANGEFIDEDDFDTAIHRAENKLVSSTEDSESVESMAAAILKGAREEYQVYRDKQIEKENLRAASQSGRGRQQQRRSLFQRGSDKYIDNLSAEDRAVQEARLSKILDGYGAVSQWLSPETDAVVTEYLANASLVNSVDIRSWRNVPQNLQQYWRTHRIDEYLTSKTAQELKSKPVFFYSPDLNSTNEQAADYDYTIDSTLIAIVEDPEGKVVIGDKKYQPVGIMPRSYDGVHNRYYHISSVNGTASLLNIRRSSANTPRGSLIVDESGTPIQTRMTSFVTGSRVATNDGYRPASQVNIDNFSESEKEETKGMSKQQIRGTQAYKRAKKRFLDTFVSKGGPTKCYIRMFDNYGRPVGGRDGLSHVHIIGYEEFGGTIGRNSNSTLEQVLLRVLENEDDYSLLYDSSVPYNEGGFNRRTQSMGKLLQNFFKNTFKIADIENLPDDKQKIDKLNEYADKLRKEVFVQKRGVYFDANRYSFVFIPSTQINGKPAYTLSLRDNFSDETFPLSEVTEGTMSDKTAAKTMANLFMYGGQIRHGFKWQIAINEINNFSDKSGSVTPNAAAKDYIEEAYDDNLLQTSKTRLAYEVNQITFQSPYNKNGELINPQPIVPNIVNEDNANINSSKPGTITTTTGDDIIPETGTGVIGPIKEETQREISQEEKEAARIGELIQEDSKDWVLTEDKTGYVNKNNQGVKHARVTSTIAADESAELGDDGKPKRFDPNSEWAIPSSLIGNSVDEFIRDFFDGKISDNFDFTSLPNASAEEWKALHNQLKAFRDGFVKDRGLTILPKNIVAHGVLDVTGPNGKQGILNVAGTLDLLAYDSNGNFYIFDMKTYRSTLKGKMEKYSRQVSIYRKLIEQRLAEQGINVKFKGLSIIPIKVTYSDAREYEYRRMQEGSNQLIMGRRGTDRLTKYMGAKLKLGIPINVDYVEPKIMFDRLTEEEQALVKWKDEDPSADIQEGAKPEKAPETPPAQSLIKRRAVRSRRRGGGLNIGGVTEEQLEKLGSMQGDIQKSLSWLRVNNPAGYEIASKFNRDRMDDTAWDKLSDDMKDSYLSCL